jgi:hypothetical protein
MSEINAVHDKVEDIFRVMSEKSIVRKDALKKDLIELNDILEGMFGTYEDEFLDVSKLKREMDEDLFLMENTIQNMQQHPEMALITIISNCKDKMQTFLDLYNIGFLYSFKLNGLGLIDVVIKGRITNKNAFGDKDVSSKMKLESQIKFLNKNGIKTIKTQTGTRLSADENTIHAIQELVFKLGGMGFEFISKDYSYNARDISKDLVVNELKFSINPYDLLNYNGKEWSIIFNESEDNLNPDEYEMVFKKLKSIYSSINTYEEMNFPRETYGSSVYHDFRAVCKTCKVETSILKKVNQKMFPIESRRKLLENYEASINDAMIGMNIKKVVKSLYEKLNKYALSNFNFKLSNLNITSTNVEAQFQFAAETLDHTSGFPSNEELPFELTMEEIDLGCMVKATEENMDKLKLGIEEIKGTIKSIQINLDNQTKLFGFDTFTASFVDLSKIV